MNFETFRNSFLKQLCFTSGQVYAAYPEFDKNNLWRWVKKGYLIKLRQGYYLFNESAGLPDVTFYVANCIYKPSYISLQTALSYYGLIPETVVGMTSVSTLKTASFKNSLAEFTYKKINERLFSGYEMILFDGNKTIAMATPEKALLDFFYLYPVYRSERDLLELRLNEDVLEESFDFDKIDTFISLFKNKRLENTVGLLKKVYGFKQL